MRLEHFGGANGELAATMQYSIQGLKRWAAAGERQAPQQPRRLGDDSSGR
jgi:Mn-containing catalase